MKNKSKTGVLLVNLGTPDSTATPDVRKYLREFLMDGRVVDYPAVLRWILVNLIIAPLRAPKSAKEYKKLWEERGSPLKFYGEDVRDLLQDRLPEKYIVKLAMRYQSPSIESALGELQAEKVSEIICIPLFPQYASATSGSVIDKVMKIARGWQIIPSIRFVSNFLENKNYIQAHVERARKYLDKDEYDHFVFSYHGVPERQIKRGSVDNYCQLGKCCNSYHSKNQFCYRAQCYQNTRLIAKELGIPEDKYTVSFQSRLGPVPWIRPYTDEVLEKLPGQGKKKVLAFSPAFVADCLETTIEVGDEYEEDFMEAGGEVWHLVEGLNTHELFVSCLEDLVLDRNGEIEENVKSEGQNSINLVKEQES